MGGADIWRAQTTPVRRRPVRISGFERRRPYLRAVLWGLFLGGLIVWMLISLVGLALLPAVTP